MNLRSRISKLERRSAVRRKVRERGNPRLRRVLEDLGLSRERLQILKREVGLIPEPGGTWVAHRAVFDSDAPRLELELVSFHRPRDVAITVDGEPRAGVRVGTGWQKLTLELPGDGARHRVELATAGCDVPMWLDLGPDTRCLSLKIRGVELRRSELYDLTADPAATTDLSRRRAELHARLGEELRRHRGEVVAAPENQQLSDETVESLRALGYIK